jgi:SAM-dependent methyltransferase
LPPFLDQHLRLSDRKLSQFSQFIHIITIVAMNIQADYFINFHQASKSVFYWLSTSFRYPVGSGGKFTVHPSSGRGECWVMHEQMPPNWRLPEGVTAGMWDYLNSDAVASNYECYLAGSTLPEVEATFLSRHLDRPGRLLDLGCGTGRNLISLARTGFACVGVDLSEPMLRRARENACRAEVALDLLRANLVQLECVRNCSFDACICLFSTLGMIRGRDARQRVIEHVHRVLRPGGKFILHVHNRWANLWERGTRRWVLRDLFAWLHPHLLAGDRFMPPHQGVANLYLHVFTRREIARALAAAELRVREIAPLGFGLTGELSWPKWLPSLRAHGFLVLAQRPDSGRQQA